MNRSPKLPATARGLVRWFTALLVMASSAAMGADEVVSMPALATRDAKIKILGDLVDGLLVPRIGDNRSTLAQPSVSAQTGSFSIVIVPGPGLSGNAPALAAFNRAAQAWAARISDPITITINADLAPLGAGIIGSASSVYLAAPYNTIRNQVVADAGDEADEAITASLPTAAQFTGTLPSGVSFSGQVASTKANLKAAGFSGLDGSFGVSDGQITFSTNFSFDFDNSNGVTAGMMDFETVAGHEIGHVLGFTSIVDSVNAGATSIDPTILDLFRFRDDVASNDPATSAEFTTFPRNYVPGVTAITDEVNASPSFPERKMSTGLTTAAFPSADGRQASHWKADELTSVFIGLLDPTLSFGQAYGPQDSDFRAMDLMGYEVVSAVSAPEIAVFNGASTSPGNERTDNTGSVSFGSVAVGASSSAVTYTIQNAGSANLTGLALSKTGHTGDYTLSSLGATTLAPNATTTFTVTFSPTTAGTRSAVVVIASNDANENPFEIPVTGTGFNVGSFNFSAAVQSVNQGAASVDLTVTRGGGTAATSVTLNTSNGTTSAVPPFAPALAGTDYTAVTTSVDFADGETSKTVPITLAPQAGSMVPNKRFTATLSVPTNFATLGTVTTATVQILANDSTKPMLTVTAPASGPNLGGLSPYLVKGAAGDTKGIARVEVVLNGGAPVVATLGAATVPTSVPYSLSIVPLSGPNTLAVTAYDLRGNSTTVSRSFNFTQRYAFSISRFAPVALDEAGTVGLSATPGANASALTPTTVNANPKISLIAPGTPVKITATAKAGYFFSHWTGLPSGAVSLGNVATFTMPATDAGATAHFVVNPFGAPAGAGNAYFGLIHPGGGTLSTHETEGFFTGNLSSTNGLFNGKLYIGGVIQPFIVYFYGDGTGLFNVGTTKQYILSFGSRALTLYFDGGDIVAHVTNGADFSAGTATRAAYSATNKAPSTLLNVATMSGGPINKGVYTVAFPSAVQSPPLSLATYPQGDGYGLVTVSETGAVSLSGTLADGTTVTGSSALLAGNTCPLFVQLTTPGQAASVKGGSIGGVLTFNPTSPTSDVTGASFRWFRPAVSEVSGTTTVALATQVYTAGWPGGITLSPWGAFYHAAVSAKDALDTSADALAFEDGKLVFSRGKLVPAITQTNLIVTGNTITKTVPLDPSFSLGLTSATGGFSGKFAPNWASPNSMNPGFKGILIQKGANRGGYGFFLSNALSDLNPESGRVAFTVEPDANAKPPVTATTPAAVVAAWPYTVQGTAGNARGLDRVTLRLNGGAIVEAILGTPTASGSVPYSLPIEPVNGANTLVITAYDLRGNLTTTTVNFNFTRRLVLTLTRIVPLGVAATPDDAGTIAFAATPASGASLPTPATANANPKTSTIVPGTVVKLTATPKMGYVFSHWTGAPGGAVIVGNLLTFTPVANLTGISATFIENPFNAPVGSSNSFYGLIHPQGGAPSNNATEGYITGTLTPGSGMFSGRVLIDGANQMFSATFYGNGSALFTVGAAKQPTLTFGGKTLTLSFTGGNVVATVVKSAVTSSGTATRAIYNAVNKLPSVLPNPAIKGLYTIAFGSKTQSPPVSAGLYPQGDGFGTLTVTDLGIVTLSGTLADGTAVTGASALVAGHTCPIFVQLVTPGGPATVLGGSFGGVLTFNTVAANTDVSATNLLWFRPAVTEVSGTTASALATQVYTGGWPGGIKVDGVGALYSSAINVQTTLGLGAPSPGNGELAFADGKLSPGIVKTSFAIVANLLTKLPDPVKVDASYTLTLSPTMGAFSGSFIPNWTPLAGMKPGFKGILIQKGANKGGFGFFLSNTPADLDPESGSVTLGAP